MRQVLGYFLGFIIFIAGIPALMWWLSGIPSPAEILLWQLILGGVIALVGLGISVWSIVYMKHVGKGNPFDAMGHEVAPRTKHLMTEGPYKYSRNPMLSGTFIYYLGLVIALWSWQALVVFVVVVALMMIQVRSEEQRLETDFGEEYLQYKQTTGRFFTFRKG